MKSKFTQSAQNCFAVHKCNDGEASGVWRDHTLCDVWNGARISVIICARRPTVMVMQYRTLAHRPELGSMHHVRVHIALLQNHCDTLASASRGLVSPAIANFIRRITRDSGEVVISFLSPANLGALVPEEIIAVWFREDRNMAHYWKMLGHSFVVGSHYNNFVGMRDFPRTEGTWSYNSCNFELVRSTRFWGFCGFWWIFL